MTITTKHHKTIDDTKFCYSKLRLHKIKAAAKLNMTSLSEEIIETLLLARQLKAHD